jgi:hypothetical protein
MITLDIFSSNLCFAQSKFILGALNQPLNITAMGKYDKHRHKYPEYQQGGRNVGIQGKMPHKKVRGNTK